MKKIYLTPAVRTVDLMEEGMIAASGEKLNLHAGENIGEGGEFTQEKDMWGNEDIWK